MNRTWFTLTRLPGVTKYLSWKQKVGNCNKIGPRGSKIDHNGSILHGFDPKITFPTSICAEKITFCLLLKIFKHVKIFFNICKASQCVFSPKIGQQLF